MEYKQTIAACTIIAAFHRETNAYRVVLFRINIRTNLR